jgi:hypothetical protein
MRAVLIAAIAGAILGVPAPALWFWNFLFWHHFIADGSGVLERLVPFFPLCFLLLMAPNSDPAVPSSYLAAFIIALLANMAFFSAVTALVTAITVGVCRAIGICMR